MKRLLCAFVLTVIFVFGCSPQTEADPFSVFSGEFTADAELACNGVDSAFTVVLRADGISITVTAPTEASGYLFESYGEEFNLSYGDILVECNEQLSLYPRLVKAVLSPSAEQIVAIRTEEAGGETLGCVETADMKYLFRQDGTPYSVSGVACGRSFEMSFSRFTQAIGGEE